VTTLTAVITTIITPETRSSADPVSPVEDEQAQDAAQHNPTPDRE
jgi:hypothetical protein